LPAHAWAIDLDFYGDKSSLFVKLYSGNATDQLNSLPPPVIEELGKIEFDRNVTALQATTKSDLALDYLIKSFIISFFISIIISVILRRQPKTN
jgi:hypothetical protein